MSFLRGLGLSFFDYVGLFTVSREGRFENEKGKLVYHPSGKEPIVYSGSRRGSLITLEEETKSKADQWHGHGY